MKKQNTGLRRDNNEQYYTKESISKFCVNATHERFPLNTFDMIIEPSAGTGSFIKALIPKIGSGSSNKILSYDIEPKYKDIIKQDYLTTHFDVNRETKILVIGNPPFGRQSSLAKKFIKHSCQFADVIAFILPKSFKKESMNNCFDLYFHKIYETNLENNAFIFENQEYSVPCIFQIWERQESRREYTHKVEENHHYTFVKEPIDATMAFRRVGVNAGKFTYTNFHDMSKQSHYFIKTNIILTDDHKDVLNSLKWDHDNTTGPKSISKQELIIILNKIFK